MSDSISSSQTRMSASKTTGTPAWRATFAAAIASRCRKRADSMRLTGISLTRNSEVVGLSDMIVRCPDDASTRTILTKELAPDSMTMCRVLTPNPSNSSLIMRPTKSSPILPRNVVDVPSFARVTSAVATLPPPC